MSLLNSIDFKEILMYTHFVENKLSFSHFCREKPTTERKSFMIRVKKVLSLILSIALLTSNTAMFSTAEAPQEIPEGSALLYVDFDEKNADNTIDGGLNNGEVIGDVTYVEGIDGGKAVNIQNIHGKTATQYIKFSGADMSESYAFSIWYRENTV